MLDEQKNELDYEQYKQVLDSSIKNDISYAEACKRLYGKHYPLSDEAVMSLQGSNHEGSETSVVVLNSGTDVLRWVADGLLEVADRVDNPKVGVVTQDYSTPLQGLDWVYELAALALHHVLNGLGEDRNKLVKEHDTESDCDSFVGHLLEPVPMLSDIFGVEEIDRRIKGYV